MNNSPNQSKIHHCTIEDYLELTNSTISLSKYSRDINFINEDGETILHAYLRSDESNYQYASDNYKSKILGIVKFIIENGVSVNSVDKQGKTPLHIAAESDKLELVRLMLNFFNNVNVYDTNGNTLLHTVVAVKFNFYRRMAKKYDTTMLHVVLEEKIRKDDLCLEIVRILLTKDADLNIKNKEGVTPVQLAVCNYNVELLQIFKVNGADFSMLTNSNENLLLHACKNCNYFIQELAMVKIIDFLVKEGCDVNGKNNEGYSPLHYVCYRDESIEKLVELGGNVNSQTKFKLRSPLHYAANIHNMRFTDRTAKATAALLRAGASTEKVDFKGRSPLDIVIYNNDMDTFEVFLEFGTDINERTTAVHILDTHEYFQELALSHAVKLKAIGFPVAKVYKSHEKFSSSDMRKLYDDCVKEVERLKDYKINDSKSIYQFLHMNDSRRQRTLGRKLPEDFRSKFPIYANFIINIYDKVLRKKQLLERAVKAWYVATKIYLPDVCIEHTLNFLTCRDWIVLIEAAKLKMTDLKM